MSKFLKRRPGMYIEQERGCRNCSRGEEFVMHSMMKPPCRIEGVAPGWRAWVIVCSLLAASAAIVFFWPMDPGFRECLQIVWAIGFLLVVAWLRRSIGKGTRMVAT